MLIPLLSFHFVSSYRLGDVRVYVSAGGGGDTVKLLGGKGNSIDN